MTRTNNRYQSILIESARLFRERGYLGTTIRDIGDALGITSAALYYHFKNKEELLQAVMLIALRELHAAVGDVIEQEQDPARRIRAAMRVHLRISIDYQDFAIVLLQETRYLTPEGRAQVIDERDGYEAIWAQMFEEGRRAGLFKPTVDPHLLRLLTFGALNLVVTWYRPTGLYRAEQIADALYLYASEGVMAGPPPLLDLVAEAAGVTNATARRS